MPPLGEWISLLAQGGQVTALIILGAWVWFEHQARLEERAERMKLQDERDQLLERVLHGLHDGTSAIKSSVEAQSDTTLVLQSLKDIILLKRE